MEIREVLQNKILDNVELFALSDILKSALWIQPSKSWVLGYVTLPPLSTPPLPKMLEPGPDGLLEDLVSL